MHYGSMAQIKIIIRCSQWYSEITTGSLVHPCQCLASQSSSSPTNLTPPIIHTLKLEIQQEGKRHAFLCPYTANNSPERLLRSHNTIYSNSTTAPSVLASLFRQLPEYDVAVGLVSQTQAFEPPTSTKKKISQNWYITLFTCYDLFITLFPNILSLPLSYASTWLSSHEHCHFIHVFSPRNSNIFYYTLFINMSSART